LLKTVNITENTSIFYSRISPLRKESLDAERRSLRMVWEGGGEGEAIASVSEC
jgi:hypothetical protein